MEFALDAGGLASSLADGDVLRLYPIAPAYQKTVTLRGNVANPGRFSLRPGMRLSDLIPDRDSLVSRDYWWKRSHLGLPVPEFEPTIATSATPAPAPNGQQAPNAPEAGSSDASQTGSAGAVASQLTATTSAGGAGQLKRNDVSLSAPEIDWDYAVIERLDARR